MSPSLNRDGPTFAGFPICNNLTSLDADVAVLGVPLLSPYPGHSRYNCVSAPGAIRRGSVPYAKIDHYDFDFGGELFAGRDIRCVDCGDAVIGEKNFSEYLQMVTDTVRTILERGAVPIVIGGDHGTTIPVLRAYEKQGPLCLVQIDAHLDWVDERDGLREGYSSPMRRASEMPWVSSMAQIGLRGQGSAMRQEVADVTAYGKSLLIRAEELHEVGIEAVVDQIPAAERYFLTVDADGLDPSIAPGVGYPTPGGVTYYQTLNLMRGLARKGKVVGMDFVEVVPELDVSNLTSQFGARMLLNLIGVLAHNGYIGA
ncbi:MAG: agmatinase [Arenicellales bacterium]|nr:agmatinase [Arenicellales bacterium]